MIKIVVTGAESTGKTTLAKEIAENLDAKYLPEYSREFLSHLDRPYTEDDLLTIAQGQLAVEEAAELENPRLLICDTSLLVMKIWGLYKYGRSHPWITRQVEIKQPDLYILPHYDVPYEYDVLRENPNDRDVLYRMYYEELHRLNVPYLIVRGSAGERKKAAIEYVSEYLDKIE